MLLQSVDNSEFELTILGYQFPEIENDEYDSNWLLISIRVKMPRGSWESTDPILLTWEVERLSNWLKSLANKEPVEFEIDFIEPNLRFKISEISREYIGLQVYFDLESRPSWAPAHAAVWVDLKVTPNDLRLAAESLRSELSRFPPRAGISAKR